MAMSKRDFEEIAGTIKRWRVVRDGGRVTADEAFDGIARDIANHCKRVNADFNRSRFLAACGVFGDKAERASIGESRKGDWNP